MCIRDRDLDSGKFTGIYSAGFEDFSEVTVDLDDSDKAYSPEHYDNVKGLRMPDGISSCVIDGETYLITACLLYTSLAGTPLPWEPVSFR